MYLRIVRAFTAHELMLIYYPITTGEVGIGMVYLWNLTDNNRFSS